MLAIIGGTSLLFSQLPDLQKRQVATPYGPAEVYCGDLVILLRHQFGLAPHRINYRACMSALAILGVGRVVTFGSAGSLKREISPGSLLIPTDYISTTEIPSIHDHAISHVSPGLDTGLSDELAAIIPEAQMGGTYVQTKGPRIETVAEVRALAGVADVVGMTLASEATLACELDMQYASICTIDNYAHGIGDGTLTYEHILETSHRHRDRTTDLLNRIAEKLA